MEAANTEATAKKGNAVRDNPCKVEGCKRTYRAKGYCNVHYKKWRRGELEAKPRYKTCCEENCIQSWTLALGLRQAHAETA